LFLIIYLFIFFNNNNDGRIKCRYTIPCQHNYFYTFIDLSLHRVINNTWTEDGIYSRIVILLNIVCIIVYRAFTYLVMAVGNWFVLFKNNLHHIARINQYCIITVRIIISQCVHGNTHYDGCTRIGWFDGWR